jgi:agmatinase
MKNKQHSNEPSPIAAFDPNGPAGAEAGIFGLPHTPEQATVVLVQAPFEATTSYGGGTSQGPRAILDASRQIDLFDVEVGRPYEAGIALLDADPRIVEWNRKSAPLAQRVIDAGGDVSSNAALRSALQQVNDWCIAVDDRLEEQVAEWLERDKLVGLVGGDHATAYGAIAAHAKRHPGMGILHFDAHADLRPAYEGFTRSHASVMWNVLTNLPQVERLVQVGIRDLCEQEHDLIRDSDGRVQVFYDADQVRERFQGTTWSEQMAAILDPLPQQVYVSFDIDGLDPTLCPHTGTPVPGGLSFQQATALIGAVVRSGRRIIGFDVVEVVPGPAGDQWDGNVGARILYKLIGWALRSR